MDRPPDWNDPRDQLRRGQQDLARELELARRVEKFLRDQVAIHEQNEADLKARSTRLAEELGHVTDQATLFATELKALYGADKTAAAAVVQAEQAGPLTPALSRGERGNGDLPSSGSEIDSGRGSQRSPLPTGEGARRAGEGYPGALPSPTGPISRTFPGWMLALMIWYLQAAMLSKSRAEKPVWAGSDAAAGPEGVRRGNFLTDLAAFSILALLLILLIQAIYACGRNQGFGQGEASAPTSVPLVVVATAEPGCTCATVVAAPTNTISSIPIVVSNGTPGAALPGTGTPLATPSLTGSPSPGVSPTSSTTVSAVGPGTPAPTETPVTESRAAEEATKTGQPIQAPPEKGRIPPAPGPHGATAVEIILDASGSMNEPAQSGGPAPKLIVAKQVVIDIVNSLPPGIDLALRVYGHRVPDDSRDASCADVELIQQLGPPNRPQLVSAINGLRAYGWTPLAHSIELAEADFTGTAQKNLIVLVSDGIETCGGQPIQVAAGLKSHSPPITLDTVGFAVNNAARQQLINMASATEGHYNDATNAATLRAAILQALGIGP